MKLYRETGLVFLGYSCQKFTHSELSCAGWSAAGDETVDKVGPSCSYEKNKLFQQNLTNGSWQFGAIFYFFKLRSNPLARPNSF